MFRRLLVPTDGSDQLSAALPLVRHMASRAGASVALVCVESPIVNMGDVLDNSKALVGHSEKVRRLEQYVEELQREGIDAHYDVEFGRPERSIHSAAKHHDSDLIVLTPHHRDGFEAVLHPSITARMFSGAHAPLLVVPERAANSARSGLLGESDSIIVVPLDGSELAERAIPFAVALAGEYGRGLKLMRVVPPPHEAPSHAAYERPSYQHLVHEARHYMATVQTGLRRATGLPADVEVTIGDPAREIADIAQESATNLIVMSTHGHGTIGRLLVGSVATEVLQRAQVPVLILPPHAVAPTSASAWAAAPVSSRE